MSQRARSPQRSGSPQRVQQQPQQDYSALRSNLEWAAAAIKHAETYSAIVRMATEKARSPQSASPKKKQQQQQQQQKSSVPALSLTREDESLYKDLQEQFPDMETRVLDRQWLQQDDIKTQWSVFTQAYKDRIPQHAMPTLVRIDADKGYSEDNTIVVSRTQFYAIEIARNRRGQNAAYAEELIREHKEEQAKKKANGGAAVNGADHGHHDHSQCGHDHGHHHHAPETAATVTPQQTGDSKGGKNKKKKQ
ncbi:polysaccharide biosynthesis domain containing protein 1 [Sorochytrium milnesiophthora]